jgi:pyruvate,water dikinase
MEHFRRLFHKPAIYAAWNWDQTVLDALHASGFADFEAHAAAYKKAHGK